jgi:hypothetical protein
MWCQLLFFPFYVGLNRDSLSLLLKMHSQVEKAAERLNVSANEEFSSLVDTI